MHDVHPYTVCTCREMYITRQLSVTRNKLSIHTVIASIGCSMYTVTLGTDTDGGSIIKLTIVHIQGVNPKLEYEYIMYCISALRFTLCCNFKVHPHSKTKLTETEMELTATMH